MKINFILTAFTIFNSCIPVISIHSIGYLSIEKNTPIYIAKTSKISTYEEIFREKFNVSLRNQGYFTVDEVEKSKYYLLINLNKKLNEKSISSILEMFLIDSKQILSSDSVESEKNNAIWVCKMEIEWIEFLKSQDQIAEIISNKFCKTSFSKRILM